MKISGRAKIVNVLIALGVSSAYAFELKPTIQIHGYGTLGASMTNATDVTVIDPITKEVFGEVPAIEGVRNHPTFDADTLGGLVFIGGITDNASFTARFLSEAVDNFFVDTDLLYFEWNITEDWDLKIGRTRLPLYLLSQDQKIGYVYPWTRPPVEVYNFFTESDFNGIILRNVMPIVGNWVSQATVGFGNSYDTDIQFAPGAVVSARNVLTTELILSNDFFRLRGAYLAGALDVALSNSAANIETIASNPCATFNIDLPQYFYLTPGATSQCFISAPPGAPYTVPVELSLIVPDPFVAQYFGVGLNFANGVGPKNASAQFLSFAYDFHWNHLVSIAEWRTAHIDDKLLPTSSAWYVLAGYNWDEITFHVTYSTTRSNNDGGRILSNTVSDTFINPYSLIGPPGAMIPETMQTSINSYLQKYNYAQSSIIAGIRYDFFPGADIKVDYRYVIPQHGTDGLFYTSDGPTSPGKRISWVTAVIDVAF